MDTYFIILPAEIKRELSLYLNYRDSILACEFLRCENAEFWIHKIRNELGYDQEFIRKYVYDPGTKISKTLLPLNEKYLELKARKFADFGTESYQGLTVLFYRISQLKDLSYANELFKYMIKFVEDFSYLKVILNDDIMIRQIIRGAASANNIELIDNILTLKYRYLNPGTSIMPKNFAKYYAGSSIVPGTYESNPKGNKDLLLKYDIHDTDYTDIYINSGLIGGDYLEELLKRNVSAIDPISLTYTYTNNAQKILNYYHIPLSADNVALLIMYGNIHLLPPPEEMIKFSEPTRNNIIGDLLSVGYLEEIEKNSASLDFTKIRPSVTDILVYNHLDTLNYLNSWFPKELKNTITDLLISNVNRIIPYCILETMKFLYNNKILNKHIIGLLNGQSLNLIRKYNPEVFDFLKLIS